MDDHLNNVDQSLEELTKKVRKHIYKEPEPESVENVNAEKPPTLLSKLLQPPTIFFIAIPIASLIILALWQPEVVMKTDPEDKKKKYLHFKRLIFWTVVLSIMAGIGVYYFFYNQKVPEKSDL